MTMHASPPGAPRRKPRDANRAEITLVCDARQGLRPWVRVRLDDLSPNGFRLARFKGVDPEVTLRLRIPGIEMLTAQVRWHDAQWLGCEFAAPLHASVFGHVVAGANAARR